jgi:hypothetical protein
MTPFSTVGEVMKEQLLEKMNIKIHVSREKIEME